MIEDKLTAIRLRMQEILRSIQKNGQQENQAKPDTSSTVISEISSDKDSSSPWLLEEWRRISIPDWRRILKESIETENISRENYARWMLSEVLKDDEYIKENGL
jgi:hypothetical protein